jgi:hypothetical protein
MKSKTVVLKSLELDEINISYLKYIKNGYNIPYRKIADMITKNPMTMKDFVIGALIIDLFYKKVNSKRMSKMLNSMGRVFSKGFCFDYDYNISIANSRQCGISHSLHRVKIIYNILTIHTSFGKTTPVNIKMFLYFLEKEMI